MKIVKKISGIMFWILLIFITIYSTFTIAQKLIWKDKTPSFMGYKNFIVLTGSMAPTLNEGDIVIVKETNNIEVNDIIAFKIENSIVTHRVKEIYQEDNKEYYITKGDANNGTDNELLNKEDIEGKYVFKIPFVGKIVLLFRKPIGIIILFIMLGLFLLLSSIKNNKEEIKKGS